MTKSRYNWRYWLPPEDILEEDDEDKESYYADILEQIRRTGQFDWLDNFPATASADSWGWFLRHNREIQHAVERRAQPPPTQEQLEALERSRLEEQRFRQRWQDLAAWRPKPRPDRRTKAELWWTKHFPEFAGSRMVQVDCARACQWVKDGQVLVSFAAGYDYWVPQIFARTVRLTPVELEMTNGFRVTPS